MKQIDLFLITLFSFLSIGITSCSNRGSGFEDGIEVPSGWVDLGLPSGLLWAECNVGANSPEEFGNYYAWGEITPKEVYNWSTYKYCTVNRNGDLLTLSKYNSRIKYSGYGSQKIDNLTTLQATDDIATVILGDGVRTPNRKEWEELINCCDSTWTMQNGVLGLQLTGPNGNSIFLPSAGYRWDDMIDSSGYGFYWSSTVGPGPQDDAWYFRFKSNDWYWGVLGNPRCNGYSVRAVRQK